MENETLELVKQYAPEFIEWNKEFEENAVRYLSDMNSNIPKTIKTPSKNKKELMLEAKVSGTREAYNKFVYYKVATRLQEYLHDIEFFRALVPEAYFFTVKYAYVSQGKGNPIYLHLYPNSKVIEEDHNTFLRDFAAISSLYNQILYVLDNKLYYIESAYGQYTYYSYGFLNTKTVKCFIKNFNMNSSLSNIRKVLTDKHDWDNKLDITETKLDPIHLW